MLHDAPRTPPDVTLALERSTISWLAGSILTVIVNVRAESCAVIVASGRPVPCSVPTVQFDVCSAWPVDAIASTCTRSPLLGFFRYVSLVSAFAKPTRSAPLKVATALVVVTVSVLPFATTCAAAARACSDARASSANAARNLRPLLRENLTRRVLVIVAAPVRRARFEWLSQRKNYLRRGENTRESSVSRCRTAFERAQWMRYASRMKKTIRLVASAGFVAALTAAAFAQAPHPANGVKYAQISPTDMKEWLSYLASDELQGRQIYTEGYGLAAAYVADHLKAWGVKPLGDQGTYFQNVKTKGYRVTRNSAVTVG